MGSSEMGWSASEAYDAYVTDVAEAVGAGLLLDKPTFDLLDELRRRAADETWQRTPLADAERPAV